MWEDTTINKEAFLKSMREYMVIFNRNQEILLSRYNAERHPKEYGCSEQSIEQQTPLMRPNPYLWYPHQQELLSCSFSENRHLPQPHRCLPLYNYQVQLVNNSRTISPDGQIFGRCRTIILHLRHSFSCGKYRIRKIVSQSQQRRTRSRVYICRLNTKPYCFRCTARQNVQSIIKRGAERLPISFSSNHYYYTNIGMFTWVNNHV